MKPIVFACAALLPLAPDEIANQILDVTRWAEFKGSWPIPGIRSATFETRAPEVVGSRIRVINRDGSSHVEEIVVWQPPCMLRLQMDGFSAPLRHLALRFVETWAFDQGNGGTHVTRTLELHATSRWTRPLLRIIAFLLKRAIARHLREMACPPDRKVLL